jgi:LPS-assembly lipoprotein
MRMNFARLIAPAAIVSAALVLAACGFRPLYATGPDGTGPGDALASIYVEPIPERVGYELRNQLLDRFGAAGRADGAAYRLKIALRENSEGVAIRPNASITRYNYTLQAHYDLFPSGSTTPLTSGDVSALAAYNVASSPYATVVAEQDAGDRAAGDIAERVRVELAVFFRNETPSLATLP